MLEVLQSSSAVGDKEGSEGELFREDDQGQEQNQEEKKKRSDPVQPSIHNPDLLLSRKFFSRPEDLECIEQEEAQLKKVVQAHNLKWKPYDKDVRKNEKDASVEDASIVEEDPEDDSENEVIVFGDVEFRLPSKGLRANSNHKPHN